MKRVAFVVQRCGIEVNGGAEWLCLQVAQRMRKYWQTEILTTCALDYVTWENYYPSGIEELGETTIRRFPVESSRVPDKFERMSENVQSRLKTATFEEQIAWMRSQGPISRPLIEYVKHHKDDYDAFIFITYLYATTCFVLPFVREKAWLLPAAHNEWPMYMNLWDDFFLLPKNFIFLTDEERDFFRTRFPYLRTEGCVTGIGIEAPKDFSGERFREQYDIKSPFLLYVGRIERAKGCEELFNYFIQLKNSRSFSGKLVLLGKSIMKIPSHPDIIHLGFVEEQTKWDAMSACEWLVNPSSLESLSIVLLEAWAVGRPVLVTERSDVLVGQCRRAQGGLWYNNIQEFEYIIKNSDHFLKDRLGEKGKQYVLKNYSWQMIEKKYLQLLA